MSGAAKRMSAEEKRKVILDIYHKSKAVYTEKEIVTLAAKAGVNANTIVDINQSLVDDGLVDKEKIGGSNYFWSFPAKKDRLLQIQHEKVLANIVILEKEMEEANLALLDAQRGREDDSELKVPSEDATTGQPNPDTTNDTKVEDENDDEPLVKKVKRMNRAQKLHRLQELAHMKTAALSELDSLKENDPQAIADLERELQLVQQAANRWTDNIFNCQTYLTKKRGMDKKQAMKLLGITDSFDYPEDKVPKK